MLDRGEYGELVWMLWVVEELQGPFDETSSLVSSKAARRCFKSSLVAGLEYRNFP
jgi:hypothetical protein